MLSIFILPVKKDDFGKLLLIDFLSKANINLAEALYITIKKKFINNNIYPRIISEIIKNEILINNSAYKLRKSRVF